jgi:dTDP-4-dehydrorhamnose reductase
MKAIFVAGKSGQLAHCLAAAAQRRGVPLVAVGRPQLDLEAAATIERAVAAIDPAAIVNAAAYTAVDKAESEPARAFAVNRDGAGRLAAAAHRRGVPFIHISTDYVFDGRKGEPYTENDATAPLNAYGRSKLAGEQAVREACPAALVLRTSWVYSPYGHNFVTTMVRRAATVEEVRVVDDQHGAPTAAGDLAGAILDILQRCSREEIAARAGVHNLAAQGETTWHGLAAAIFAGLSARGGRAVPRLVAISSAEYPTAARRPANSRLDCAAIERRFGIRLPPWRQSLNSCLDQLLAEAEPQRC